MWKSNQYAMLPQRAFKYQHTYGNETGNRRINATRIPWREFWITQTWKTSTVLFCNLLKWNSFAYNGHDPKSPRGFTIAVGSLFFVLFGDPPFCCISNFFSFPMFPKSETSNLTEEQGWGSVIKWKGEVTAEVEHLSLLMVRPTPEILLRNPSFPGRNLVKPSPQFLFPQTGWRISRGHFEHSSKYAVESWMQQNSPLSVSKDAVFYTKGTKCWIWYTYELHVGSNFDRCILKKLLSQLAIIYPSDLS